MTPIASMGMHHTGTPRWSHMWKPIAIMLMLPAFRSNKPSAQRLLGVPPVWIKRAVSMSA
jgi:hypothetical protein